MSIRIVLADDHYLVREGVRRLLETHPGLEVVATCADLDELLAAAEKLFKEVDANKDGKLDEKEIGEGLNRLFAPPPGFGRPPGPPPGGEPGTTTPEKPKKEEGK